MRNNKDIALPRRRILEAGFLVFLSDLRYQGIESLDDILG